MKDFYATINPDGRVKSKMSDGDVKSFSFAAANKMKVFSDSTNVEVVL